MKYALTALIFLAACSPPQLGTRDAPEMPAAAPAPSVEGLPAGAYTIDKSHTSILFRANHLGFTQFIGRFTDYEAQLQLDPANPSTAALNVTIDPSSFASDNAPAGFYDIMLGPQFFDVAAHPQMSYRSTAIEMTGANTARIIGDLTMHGVTKPVVLEATFNGGYPGHPLDPNARIGFSAHGTLKRSDFDMGYGIPAPGTTMGVYDDIEIVIETEFSGPAWVNPDPAAAPPAQ